MSDILELARRKLTFALDVPDWDKAREIAGIVASHVGRIKLGPVILDNNGTPQVIKAMHQAGISNIFVDLKYHNTPDVVAATVHNVTAMGVGMINVHCSGGIKMMHAAKQAAVRATLENYQREIQNPLIIGVTILTTLDYDDLVALGIFPNASFSNPDALVIHKKEKMEHLVVSLARAAQKAGLDGVAASVHEAPLIRNACGPNFRIVTPGIRPAGADAGDQKRLDTPANAIKAGADELVVGSPIYKDPNPAEAAERIVREIAEALTVRTETQTETRH
ncbi:MAG: orotidine 5'-phosphate decarboxylase [Candidatus Ryanbacteria bacterium RIFCSPLOWO2_01_FULL_48_26]|uniref:Orotidine 5'-phosphate decarboxylase n=1 Tax=Candidatus Ryanbacteria bacterium RIFCSPLOWO2_01_FULL_48_26 TaxID=1802126 RepID=A0A1G2GWF1_9BACT|nr:MAG: orotidine 5'-phosphate decarboxylase [Candidatus Ryanbacteria bacterium RIFCSPLOWO2_01_FULL_48_26]